MIFLAAGLAIAATQKSAVDGRWQYVEHSERAPHGDVQLRGERASPDGNGAIVDVLTIKRI